MESASVLTYDPADATYDPADAHGAYDEAAVQSSALSFAPVPADPCEDYDGAIEVMNDCKEELGDAEEEYREAKARLEAAKQSLFDAKSKAQQFVEENMDALLAKPTPWNEKYHRLKAFKEEHGHCNARRNKKNEKGTVYDVSEEERTMGVFVYANRKEARNGTDGIELYKKVALDAINFDWDPHESYWNAHYEELKRFKEEHGHTSVPKATHDPLHRWVRKVRQTRRILQRGEKPKSTNIRLDAERIRMLDELEFVWEPLEEARKKREEKKAAEKVVEKRSRREIAWDAKFAMLEGFYKAHGHTVPGDECIKKLQGWTANQAKEALKAWDEGKASKLSTDQLFRLRKINFIYKTKDVAWIRSYKKLIAYQILFEREVDGELDDDHLEEIRTLRKWIATQEFALQSQENADAMGLRNDFLKLFENAIGRPSQSSAAAEANDAAESIAQKKRKAQLPSDAKAQLPSDAKAGLDEKRQRLGKESLPPIVRGPMYHLPMSPPPFYPFPHAYPHPPQMYMYPPPPPPQVVGPQQGRAMPYAPPQHAARASGVAVAAPSKTSTGQRNKPKGSNNNDDPLEAAELV